jgi:hypothetical protein
VRIIYRYLSARIPVFPVHLAQHRRVPFLGLVEARDPHRIAKLCAAPQHLCFSALLAQPDQERAGGARWGVRARLFVHVHCMLAGEAGGQAGPCLRCQVGGERRRSYTWMRRRARNWRAVGRPEDALGTP